MTNPVFFNTFNWRVVVFTLAAIYALYLFGCKKTQFFQGSKSQVYGFILAIGAWLYIGTRPTSMYMDTGLYTLIYNLVQRGTWSIIPGSESEWFWSWLEYFCIRTTDASGWLTIIAFGYVGGMCVAAWKWMRNHFTLAVFFLFTAFSFWGYATNGIRNGLATSIMLMALSFVKPEYRKNWVYLLPAIVLVFLSTGTHNSMYLLAAASIISFLYPSKKYVFFIWGVCLILSPVSTNIFQSIGGGFIEDERFTTYNTTEIDTSKFSRTGWRWDFIIYSAMPIILGWYVVVKRKFYDWTYLFLLNIYIYSNCFFLLINKVAYSNRYAYLSWFIYPIVLLMPLVKFRIWKSQPVVTGGILLASIAFTLIF